MPFTNLFLPLRRRTATFRQLLFRAILVRTLVSDRLSHSLALLLRMASSSPNPFPEKTSVTPDPILRVAAASHLRSTGSGACRMTSTADLMGETPNLAALTTAHRPNARLIVACFGDARLHDVRRISLRHVERRVIRFGEFLLSPRKNQARTQGACVVAFALRVRARKGWWKARGRWMQRRSGAWRIAVDDGLGPSRRCKGLPVEEGEAPRAKVRGQGLGGVKTILKDWFGCPCTSLRSLASSVLPQSA